MKPVLLASPSPRRFVYKPGQFLAFAIEVGGVTVHRGSTIASAPARPDTVASG